MTKKAELKTKPLSLPERNAYRRLEDVVGCKWSAAVVAAIGRGVTRPGQLERFIGANVTGVTQNSATSRLVLTGTNPYTGDTTVNAGKLFVNNMTGSGTGSGIVAVNSGGTLGGTGTVGGAVTVAAGGTLAPGASAGTLILGSANAMEINVTGATNDLLVVSSGTLTYAGHLDIALTGTPGGGQVFTLYSAPACAGSFNSVSSPGSGKNWYLGDLANNGTVRYNNSPTNAGNVFLRAAQPSKPPPSG